MQGNDAGRSLFRNARREAVFVVVVWALALAWSVGYSYLFGYDHGPESWAVRAGLVPAGRGPDLRLVLGLPAWVVHGILAPWVASTAATVCFCFFWMRDDDLGTEAGEGEVHGH